MGHINALVRFHNNFINTILDALYKSEIFILTKSANLYPLLNYSFWRGGSPIRLGSETQAGPGLQYSAAIGPRLLVGVHGCCWMPPIFHKFCFTRYSVQISWKLWMGT